MRPADIELPPTISVPIPMQLDKVMPDHRDDPMNVVTQASPDRLTLSYHRLLALYPASWRRRNGAAIVGALLDQAEAEGRARPSWSDVSSLALGGIQERLAIGSRASWFGPAALGAGAGLSFAYLFVSWAPLSGIPGSLGPFSNPSVLVCALWLASFILSLASHSRAAGLLVAVCVPSEIALAILSDALHWQGPGWATVSVFAILGLVASGGSGSRKSLAAMSAASTAALIMTTFTFRYLPGNPGAWSLLLEVVPATAIAVIWALLARGSRRSSTSSRVTMGKA